MSVISYTLQEADGQQYEVTGISTDTLTIRRLDDPNGGGLKTVIPDATFVRRRWKFMIYLIVRLEHHHMQLVKISDDEMHIVVFDRTGLINGFRKDTAGERTNFCS